MGNLPVILMELDAADNPMDIEKKYIYAHGQVLAQHDIALQQDDMYFYLHDRLGSVRQIIEYDDQADDVDVVKYYAYEPFGEVIDSAGSFDNAFMFTGQYFDSKINEYYLRARQYNPHIGRFTSRDPVFGEFKEPMTLHPYLYCLNDPVNRTDPEGRSSALVLANPILTGAALYAHGLNLATYSVSSGNDKFWSLADATFLFMPVGMTVASIGPRGITDVGMGAVVGGTFEALTHMTGMGFLESAAIDPYAYYLYASYMLNERANLSIWWDMEDFVECKKGVWR